MILAGRLMPLRGCCRRLKVRLVGWCGYGQQGGRDELGLTDLIPCVLAVLGLGLVARVEAPDGVADAEAEVMPLRMLLALPWVGVEDILGTLVRKLAILASEGEGWCCYEVGSGSC